MTSAPEMIARRQALLAKLTEAAVSDPRIAGLWLQGSLARGDDDPFSDVDAYLAVQDSAFNALWSERGAILEQLGHPFVWSDTVTPAVKAIHAVMPGGIKLDLFFEQRSAIGKSKRPAVKLLFDRGGVGAQLLTGSEPPSATIGLIIAAIIKMTRQGATWPLRLLHRGQWSTLAMMELDLISGQLAQLMAVQQDAAHFYSNQFALYRLLSPEQQALIDRLTAAALSACSAHDSGGLKAVHMEVYDGLVREGRAACAALKQPYPLAEKDEQDLRGFLAQEWPV